MAMDPDALVDWFTSHNGAFDRAALTFAHADTLGWGAFALTDIQVLNRQNAVNSSCSNTTSHPSSKVTPSFLSRGT